MSDSIFVPEDGGYRRLGHVPFPLEDDLQQLLNGHPELIALTEDAKGTPIRLLLVKHEAPVPDRSTDSDRWSLDHLFVDSDLVPTLVESKRARNPQVRREVVGQLLEYAAQAWVAWTADNILAWLTSTYPGGSLGQVLTDFFGRPVDAAEVAGDIQRNLRAGRLRLLFVSDGVPDELQAIVEFLNTNTLPGLEVLAVELRMYGDSQVVVPKVIGNTATAKATKSRPTLTYDELLQQGSEPARRLDAELRRRWEQTGRTTEVKGKSLRLLTREGTTVLYFHPDSAEAWFNEALNHPDTVIERYRAHVQGLTGKDMGAAKMLRLTAQLLQEDFDAAWDLLMRYTADLEPE